MNTKRGVIILILLGMILPNFSFAQGEGVKLPENWEDIKAIGQRLFDVIVKDLPGVFVKIWQEEVLPIWQKMWNWLKENIFDPYINPFFKKEIESRKPIIGTEFQKEKKEMKEGIKIEAPQLIKSFWDKFKELIK